MIPYHYGKVLTYMTRQKNSGRSHQSTANSPPPDLVNGTASPSVANPITPLPPWNTVLSIAELYLLYCESQPLPLFHRATFVRTLGGRDPEIIYAVLATSVRFSEGLYANDDELVDIVNSYAEVARGLVTKRVWEGPVELSTLQSLCLLSLVDFTSKTFHPDDHAIPGLTRNSRWEHTPCNDSW